MDKGNDTATYLVQKFITSDYSYDIALDPYDLIILFVIARYLDMPMKRCFGKQTTLAKDCHMSIREFKRRTEKLSRLGIILRYLKGKLYRYELGEQITGIEQ